MRIIVFGGAGDMGSRAVEDLVTTSGVDQVTIADRNVAAADKLAASLRGQGAAVDVKAVDANDHDALVEAMRGYDVAASCLGPFYRFETPLVRAAIEAGVDYASICDDWSAAQGGLTELDEPARRAGRVVITGLGTSPGLSNVCIRYLAQQMDRTRRVDVNVYQPLNAGGGEAVLKHMLHIISGEVAVWREGRQVMVPACSEERLVEFPRFGRVRVWNMGHSEPVTVPRFIPGVEECGFFMGFGRGASLFILPARRGLFGSESRIDRTARMLAPLEHLTGGRQPAAGGLRVDVWGEKGTVRLHRMVCGVGQMREATALCLSVGVQMLARKELTVKEGGVYAPEACLEPTAVMSAMRAKGIEAYEDLAMTKPLA
ncbi:MAG: saccharopine dehydrogenase family protein [Dehalococcoidia bacterium]